MNNDNCNDHFHILILKKILTLLQICSTSTIWALVSFMCCCGEDEVYDGVGYIQDEVVNLTESWTIHSMKTDKKMGT